MAMAAALSSCLCVRSAHSCSVSDKLSAGNAPTAMPVQEVRQSKVWRHYAVAQHQGSNVPVYLHQRPASQVHLMASNIRPPACVNRTLPARNNLSCFGDQTKSLPYTLRHNRAHSARAVRSGEQLTEAREELQRPGDPNGSPGLPPGNVGLPVLGETLEFFKSQNSDDPDSFVRERRAKYGRTFLTNLLGNNTVIVTAPEVAELLLTDEKQFKTEWPKSTRLLLGEKSLSISQGARHKYMRGLVTGPLSLDNLKRYVPFVEERVLAQLGTWEDGTTVAAYEEMKTLTFSIISELIFGTKPGPQQDRLSSFFDKWLVGLFSLFAVRIPFTSFAASMDARDAILKETAGILKERRAALASGAPVPNDILTRLITEKDAQGAQLSDEDLQDNLITLLFAGHDTSASALASIIRCLSENPAVVEKLREEYADVRRSKGAGEPLTWEDVRKLSYTEKVISEGLRVRPIVANNFKVATRDVSIDGYVIPAGHNVTLNYRAIMRSEAFFPEPTAFKPERFDDKPAPYTFLPFGSGARQCPGSALARMEMAVFLYHFVSDWDWTLVNPAEATSYFPLPQPVEGLPIKNKKRSSVG